MYKEIILYFKELAMSTIEHITHRIKNKSGDIIQLNEKIDWKWAWVLIEAWKMDLQKVLWSLNRPVEKEFIQNTQNYLFELHEIKLPSWKTEILELFRKTFRETTKEHNQHFSMPWVQTELQFPEIKDENPKKIEQISEVINKEAEKVVEIIKQEPRINSKPRIEKSKVTPKPTPPAPIVASQKPTPFLPKEVNVIQLPESYIKNSIFGPSKTKTADKTKQKSKSEDETQFDRKMREQSPSQQKVIKRETPTSTETTYIALTKEEINQIKTIYDSEVFNEIRMRSDFSKLEEIRTIQKNYETVIMNYIEIISILINQNQTEKTETQKEYIEKIRNILYELRNYINNTKNSLFIFKSNEQKENSSKKFNIVSKHIKLLVQFN